MQRALNLIENSDLTISEVGFKVGFKDPSYFIKVFKKHFGKLPGDIIDAKNNKH